MAIVILKRNETDSRLPRIKNARLLTYEEMKKYNCFRFVYLDTGIETINIVYSDVEKELLKIAP